MFLRFEILSLGVCVLHIRSTDCTKLASEAKTNSWSEYVWQTSEPQP